jgi:hypothetical protein
MKMIEHERNNLFMQAGEIPRLDSIYALALYDPKDGKIRHMHHVITLENASKTDPQLLEKDAIANAKKLGHNTDSLKVLHLPNFEDPTSVYRVDVERKTLIKIPEMTLSKISKNGESEVTK